jgi:DNA-binding response OmpR family regulator
MSTILIAVPHDVVARQFVATLEPEGHAFVLCKDGDAVRDALGREMPDLVIADVDLPGMDAFELVQLLYDRTSDATVPLIVIHSGISDREEGPLSDVTGFTWMGLATGPEALRSVVKAKLSVGPAPAESCRVLVVDDEPAIRNALSARLKMEGYTVISAQDGQEGLDCLQERPDVVLLDVDMPRMDGFTVLERMRAEPDWRDIPVIVMTAHARNPEEVSRGLGLGANDYLRKPFDLLELVARVQTQLRLRDAQRLAVEKNRDLAVIELAGAAAHEINNPLSVLVARLELKLSEEGISEADRQHLEQMQVLVFRIAEVVRKLGHVRRYQVQTYCGDVNILDLDAATGADAE